MFHLFSHVHEFYFGFGWSHIGWVVMKAFTKGGILILFDIHLEDRLEVSRPATSYTARFPIFWPPAHHQPDASQYFSLYVLLFPSSAKLYWLHTQRSRLVFGFTSALRLICSRTQDRGGVSSQG
jgi:hypothetical protein